MTEKYDCVVIGGGPSGSTVSALVAQAGFKTLLVERERVPRFHVGESLMPETYWTLKRLGMLERMRGSHFPKKYSVQFVSHTGRESQPFYFFERDSHESSQTWQVLRSEFDQMLFENAAQKGADCRDQTRVLDVMLDGDRAEGVRIKGPDGATREVRAPLVVDATGQQALIASKLGFRKSNARLQHAAIWGYYRGARRDPGIDEGATLVLYTHNKKGWFWYIPLPEDIVSVGVVAGNDYLLKGRGAPESVFEEELVKCPAVAERLMDAQLVSDFRVIRDYSYVSTRAAGEGWVLVGDAFGFLDPIYSSGVFFALKSGEMAADAILEGFGSGDLSGPQLGKWAQQFADGMEWMRRLVYAFYTETFSFGQFVRRCPQHKGSVTDLLVGKVFLPGIGKVFDDMAPMLEPRGEQVAFGVEMREKQAG